MNVNQNFHAMKQYINFECLTCKVITRHDILVHIPGIKTTLLKISCSKCATPSFTIDYPKEIVEANIMTDHNGTKHFNIDNDFDHIPDP